MGRKANRIIQGIALAVIILTTGTAYATELTAQDSTMSQTDQLKKLIDDGINIKIGTRQLRLMGYAQSTYNVMDVNHRHTNELAIQRVILMAQANLTDRLGFFLMADVASTDSKKHMHEYYAQYEFMPELKVRIGQFKQPFMLENIIPPTLLGNIQMNEATLYETAIATDSLQGNTVGRDAGVMLTGDLFPACDGHRQLNYSVGVFNGVGMNTKENNSQKDFIGMVNYLPIKDITISTSFILGTGHALTNDIYSSIRKDEDYSRKRWSIGTEMKLKPLLLRSEYVQGWNNSTRSRAFYIESWVHLWKGLDLVLDYDYLNKNVDLSREQQAALPLFTETHNYIVGVQYWVYRQCRVSTQFVLKDRRTGPDIHQWITQFQIAF